MYGVYHFFDIFVNVFKLNRRPANSRAIAELTEDAIKAAQDGNIRSLRSLLDKGALINEMGANSGPTLVAAVQYNRLECAIDLLKKGANPNCVSYQNITPLHWCFYARSETPPREMIELLLKNGANIRAKTTQGKEPLHFLVSRDENFQFLEMFLEKGADINCTDISGQTALMLCVRVGNAKWVKKLLELDASFDVSENVSGMKAIHLSVRFVDCLRLLIKKGANINSRDSNGKTPLFYYMPSLDILHYLLKNGGDIDAVDNFENTVLHSAIQNHSPEQVVIELMKLMSPLIFTKPNRFGMMPADDKRYAEYFSAACRAKFSVFLLGTKSKDSPIRILPKDLLKLIFEFTVWLPRSSSNKKKKKKIGMKTVLK